MLSGQKEKRIWRNQILPDVSEGMDGQVEQTEVLDKKTQPKKRYTVEGILAMMEINHIGTGATRAEILKKLLTKKKGNPEAYLKQQKNVLISTGLARALSGIFRKNFGT